ncbi:hypothetical protein ACFVJW_26570 [Streptomyces libani]|uniref:hypothetical protein n=1 Tax=Streptomyces nigrescens TaxID=1920 RepID=UPI00362F0669
MKENGPRPSNPQNRASNARSAEAVAFLEEKFDEEQLARKRARLLREATARLGDEDTVPPDEVHSLMECAGFTDEDLGEVMEIAEQYGFSITGSISHLHWRRRFHQRMAEWREEDADDPPQGR